MRRLRDRPPRTLFRGAELPRIMTMVVMLGVLAMLVKLAADSKTWRWLAPDAAEPVAADNSLPPAAKLLPDVAPAAGPTDRDPQEQDAAREEFQVLTDKSALTKEEMPAYWRLMSWQEHQSTAELLEHAATNVTYNELFTQPDQWRGKLVQLRVHLQQTAKADDLPENPPGLTSLHEVWGWNTDSQPYTYWFVVPRLPPGMPSGQRIVEEATFVGYFFKLLKYEDRQGVTRATPLLVGRLIWHPTPSGRLARSGEWQWVWYLAGIFLVWFVARRDWRSLGETPSGDERAGWAKKIRNNSTPGSTPRKMRPREKAKTATTTKRPRIVGPGRK